MAEVVGMGQRRGVWELAEVGSKIRFQKAGALPGCAIAILQ